MRMGGWVDWVDGLDGWLGGLLNGWGAGLGELLWFLHGLGWAELGRVGAGLGWVGAGLAGLWVACSVGWGWGTGGVVGNSAGETTLI